MNNKLSRNIKKGDIVICVNDVGHSSYLQNNKEYVVLEYFKVYNREHIKVNGYLSVFAERFLTKQEIILKQRKEKINIINNI